ncbi:MAG: hypothetical protein FWC00_05890 [Firmicutes bacterium]|nr:hypothetical protein [Bacillota bacterium]
MRNFCNFDPCGCNHPRPRPNACVCNCNCGKDNENPPTPPTPPVTPGAFVAAGEEFWNVPTTPETTAKIPFEEIKVNEGDAIFFIPRTTNFVVLKNGEYTVEYKIAHLGNPAVPEGHHPMEITVKLISTIHGVLDSFTTNTNEQSVSRSRTLILQAGEILSLEIEFQAFTEVKVRDYEISIKQN